MQNVRWLALVAATSVACALPHAELRGDAAPQSDGGMDVLSDVPAADVRDEQDVQDVIDTGVDSAVPCPSGQLRCGANCVDPQTSPMHCGACGTACGATEECASGACRTICAAPRRLCGTDCVDTQSSAMNCGACGTVCPMGQSCLNGACTVDCGAMTNCSGSCVNLQTSASNCGACGMMCPAAQSCVAGRCVCPTGQTLCGASCVNTQTNNNHCGACNTVCRGGTSCATGVCRCPAGTHDCSGACVMNNSIANCGPTSCTPCPAPPANATATCDGTACGFACNPGFTLMGGACVPMCSAGTHLCGTTCVMNNNIANCGPTSCTPCPAPAANGAATCDGTTCGITCNPGFMPMGTSCVAMNTCGNGVIDSGETCDDGRPPANGDGCSSTCALEMGYVSELCADARTSFALALNQTIRIRANTAGAMGGGDACAALGPELVYSIRTSNAGTVTVRVIPIGPWNPVLKSVQGNGSCTSDCTNAAVGGGTETRTYAGLGANTNVTAVVDGLLPTDSGQFTLEFSLAP